MPAISSRKLGSNASIDKWVRPGEATRDIPESLFTVHLCDARQLNGLIEPFSPPHDPLLTCTITSPPYGDLKNYGYDDQIGYGQSFDDYLIEMRRVFRSIYRHTRRDGSLWVVADTLRGGEHPSSRRMEPLPFQLAAEAADSGWILRESIIWLKDKTLPWSSGNRLRNSFEYILLLVKSNEFKFNVDRLRDPTELSEWWVRWPERYNPHGMVPTNVWDIPIPVQGSWKKQVVQHACPLPPDLVERLLLLSTDPGDVVFDPFAGTGTVVAEAERLGRRGIGTELNRGYVRAFERLVRPEIEKRNSNDRIMRNAELVSARRDALIKLRVLKFAKVITQGLSKEYWDLPAPFAVAVIHDPFDRKALSESSRPLRVRLTMAVEGPDHVLAEVEKAIQGLIRKAPASKFGVEAVLDVVSPRKFAATLSPRKKLWLYEAGRTWTPVGQVFLTNDERLAKCGRHKVNGNNYRYPPILSNLKVSEKPDTE